MHLSQIAAVAREAPIDNQAGRHPAKPDNLRGVGGNGVQSTGTVAALATTPALGLTRDCRGIKVRIEAKAGAQFSVTAPTDQIADKLVRRAGGQLCPGGANKAPESGRRQHRRLSGHSESV